MEFGPIDGFCDEGVKLFIALVTISRRRDVRWFHAFPLNSNGVMVGFCRTDCGSECVYLPSNLHLLFFIYL